MSVLQNTAAPGQAKGFETLECSRALAALRLPRRGSALLECLGNLAANELYSAGSVREEEAILTALLAGVAALEEQCEHLVIVSNEVCLGGEEYAGDTDAYLRVLAAAHRALGQRAGRCAKCVPAGRCTTRERGRNSENDAGNAERGFFHVFGAAGAALCVEQKKHALCPVCFSAGGCGRRRGLVALVRGVRLGAGGGCTAGGRDCACCRCCLPAASISTAMPMCATPWPAVARQSRSRPF